MHRREMRWSTVASDSIADRRPVGCTRKHSRQRLFAREGVAPLCKPSSGRLDRHHSPEWGPTKGTAVGSSHAVRIVTLDPMAPVSPPVGVRNRPRRYGAAGDPVSRSMRLPFTTTGLAAAPLPGVSVGARSRCAAGFRPLGVLQPRGRPGVNGMPVRLLVGDEDRRGTSPGARISWHGHVGAPRRGWRRSSGGTGVRRSDPETEATLPARGDGRWTADSSKVAAARRRARRPQPGGTALCPR